MAFVTRVRQGQSVKIGNNIEIQASKAHGGWITLWIEAPKSVKIYTPKEDESSKSLDNFTNEGDE